PTRRSSDLYSIDEKLNYYSYYQLALFNQYQNYLQKIEKQKTADQAPLSMLDLQLNDTAFQEFQQEFSELMMKYYKKTDETSSEAKKNRFIGVTIIPDATYNYVYSFNYILKGVSSC